MGVLIKIVLTMFLLGLLSTKIDLFEVMEILSSLNFVYFIAAICSIPVLYVIRTYRWHILLKEMKINESFIRILIVTLIGTFYGSVTPGKFGEIARVYYLDADKFKVIPTILVEKIIDVSILILLSILTVILFFNAYVELLYIIVTFALAFIISCWLLTNKNLVIFLAKFLKITTDEVDQYMNVFLKLFDDTRTALKLILLSVFYYLIAYILAYFILLSLDINTKAVVALPIIVLMGNIPLTISGLGLRESVSAICFILMGESSVSGVSFSLLLFIIIVLLPAILGYLTIIIQKQDNRQISGQITGLLSPILEKWRLNKIRWYIVGHKVLDFGCGCGKLAIILSEGEYVGVDIDKNVLERARKINEGREHVKFLHVDELKNKNYTFNTIILAAVIEHVDNPIQNLVSLKRHLEDDGRIIITTPAPNANKILKIGAKLGLFSKEAQEEHKKLLNELDFIQISEKTNLTLEHYERFELGFNQLMVYRNERI